MIAIVIAGLGGANPARAAEEPQGFVGGLALGAGWLRTQDCGGGHCDPVRSFARLSALNLKLGWLLDPRFALLLYVPGGMHERDGKPHAFEAVGPALQYWIDDRLWLLGGVGVTLDVPVLFTSQTGFYFGPNASAAVGYEVWRTGRFSLDLQTRLMLGRSSLDGGVTRTSAAVDGLVGFNWR